MSLSARDQQALASIEDDLVGSAPELATMLATFTRLTSGEEMPADENVAGARRDTRDARIPSRRQAFWRAVPMLWMLIAVVAIALAMAVFSRGGSRNTCVEPWAVACRNMAPSHSARSAPKSSADRVPPATRSIPADRRPAA